MDGDPLVIEKHRHRLSGGTSSVFYACGPARNTREEADQDARIFSRLQKLGEALKLLDQSTPAPAGSEGTLGRGMAAVQGPVAFGQ
jgi:hypothetical protein